MNSVHKVLFLSLSGIGNYIMQSPTIARYKEAKPQSQITVWVAPRGTRKLAEADPNVDKIIEMPIKTSIIQHIQQLQILHQKKFDIGIVLSPGQLIKSAAYLYLANIPERVGAQYNFGGNPQNSLFLTKSVKEKPNLHDIEQNLNLLTPLRVQPQKRITNYELRITAKHKKEALKILSQNRIPTDKLLIGIHAGSSPEMTFKRWPSKNFAQVATELIIQHNAHILIFGGPDEEAQKNKLQAQIEDRVPRSYKLEAISSVISAPLMATAAVLQKCELVLSNDSGLMHLAAATGVKTYGLFGPTNEKLTGPRGKDSHVIRAPGTKPVYDTDTSYQLGSGPHSTITAITPQMVLGQLELPH